MTSELKPCPFCGSAAEETHDKQWNYRIRCANKQCGASTRQYHDNRNGAIIAWNTRAERTCHVTKWREETEIEYDEQGYTFDCCGCTTAISRLYEQPSYCPNCGAKVVN